MRRKKNIGLKKWENLTCGLYKYQYTSADKNERIKNEKVYRSKFPAVTADESITGNRILNMYTIKCLEEF